MVAIAVRPVRPVDLLELTKPRIVALVVLTVAAGFYLAAPTGTDTLVLFVHTLFGTALVAAGTNALNQVAESDVDARMRRTARRPIPAGRLDSSAAAAFAWTAGVAGMVYLTVFVNGITAFLAGMTLLSYVWAYTTLKRTTSLSTLVGAVPGALPIVGGWTAGGGTLGPEAWSLFWILFVWQLPHFLALAWIYREDYARAGLRMLSVSDSDGRSTFAQASLYAAALVPVSLVPTMLGIAGGVYFFGALVLSVWLTWMSVRALLDRTVDRARRLFSASVTYLPVLLLLMAVNRTS